MWNFNDLAKKAQELQEQANQAASSLTTTSSLFNLDAMQFHSGGPPGNDNTRRPRAVVEQAVRPVQPTVAIDTLSTPIAVPMPRSKTPTPKGKLQVPNKKTHKPLATAPPVVPTTPDTKPESDQGTAQKSVVDENSEAKVEETGWGDDDLDLGGDNLMEDVPSESLDSEKKPLVNPDNTHLQADTEAHQSTVKDESSDVVLQRLETEPLTDKVTDVSENGNMGTVTNIAIGDVDQTQLGPVTSSVNQTDTKEEEENQIELRKEDSEAIQHEMQSTSAQEQITRKSLLILASSTEPKCIAMQNYAYSVLQAKGIPYEVVDVGDHTKKEIADELETLSNISGKFPQFFLLDGITGTREFWGTYERFQKVDETGAIDAILDDSMESSQLSSNVSAATPDDMTSEAIHENESGSNELTVEAGRINVSDDFLQQFTSQIKRLEDNHQQELSELEQRYSREIEELKQSMNHDACEAAMKKLEQRYESVIRSKEEKLREIMQINEGHQLKLEVLKREVDGGMVLLEAKDKELAKANEEYLRKLRSWENKLREADQNAEKALEHEKKMEASLEAAKNDLAASKQEHADLKARVKVVAGELKDRRTECRELHSKVDELSEANRRLQAEIEKLEFQLSDKDKCGSERTEEMEQLRKQLVDANSEVQRLKKIVEEKDEKTEKALAEYKKKAQSSLALANSRTAAAVQAKEEAELEARAARSTADAAMERAVKAELASKDAVSNANVYVAEMEREKTQALKQCAEAENALKMKDAVLQEVQASLDRVLVSNREKSVDWEKTLAALTNEKKKSSALQDDLTKATARINLLREEAASLREQVRLAEAASISSVPVDVPIAKPSDTSEFETVVVLQQELQDAKHVIEELKEALKNAVETNEKTRQSSSDQPGSHAEASNGSTPLFYAMEKHAELNIARAEINRLANLLSDAQSEKTEALEATDQMKKRMEEAEARLKRYEKLRSLGEAGVGSQMGISNGVRPKDALDSSAINVEYLKNIMLSYLNAKTLLERKALVPVIGAVLCLTPDEQHRAMANLEESASIGGVGNTIFETISGKLLSK